MKGQSVHPPPPWLIYLISDEVGGRIEGWKDGGSATLNRPNLHPCLIYLVWENGIGVCQRNRECVSVCVFRGSVPA